MRVFLSYRREDCRMHAGRLAENLRARPGFDVFLDVDTVRLGENFVRRIEREITSCDAVLVMIGDDWLRLADDDGRPRIDNELDHVHLEIKSALERDIPVIPVLVENAGMPRPSDLPGALRELAYRNGATLSDERWPQDIEQLAAALRALRPEPDRLPSTPPARTRRERAPINFDAALRFIASVPRGRWTTYKDVAIAAGSPNGAQAIGAWLLKHGAQVPSVWRVLDRRGEVSDGWSPKVPHLPQNPEGVRELLRAEGIRFHADAADPSQRWSPHDAAQADPKRRQRSDIPAAAVIVAARSAYPDYLHSSSYICQPGRAFRDVERMGFYANKEIKREVPRILHRRDHVRFTGAHADELRSTGDAADAAVAGLIDESLGRATDWRIRRNEGEDYQVFLLSAPHDAHTLQLAQPVRHCSAGAFTQGQRYVDLTILERNPGTTDELGAGGQNNVGA